MLTYLDPADFAAAVGDVARIVPSRHSAPILAGILIEADFASVTFSAFDYERSLKVAIAADVRTPDRTVVSGRLLAAIAKVLPRKRVELRVDSDGLVVNAGSSTFRLPMMNADDYPILPIPDEAHGAISGAVFTDAVVRAAGASARNEETEQLAMLAGISIETDGAAITFTATDRYRLSTQQLEWQPVDGVQEVRALVKASDIVDLARAVRPEDSVRLHFGENTFAISTPLSTSTLRMIANDFPAWRRMIPSTFNTLVSIDAAELAAALKRASVTVEAKATHATLDFGGAAALLRSSADHGSCDEEVSAKVVGDPIEVRFNTAYALNAIAALGADSLTIGIVNDRLPLIVYPGDHIEHDDGPFPAPDLTFWHMVMPVRKPVSR